MSARTRALQLLAESPATGSAFLQVAAEALALGLDCPWTGFGRPSRDRRAIETLVLWNRGALVDALRYEAEDSPCGAIYAASPDHPYRYYEKEVTRRFSKPPFLADLGIQSYRGEAIFDGDGQLLGHLFAMSDRAKPESAGDKAFFRLVGRRAGAEYRRLLTHIALRESEKGNRDIVERLPDLVCRFLPDGTRTFVNGAYCRFFGRPRHELLGTSFFSRLSPGTLKNLRRHLDGITPAHPEAAYVHCTRASASGVERWLHWIDRALFDEQGKVIEFYSIGRDITEERIAQEARRESEELIRSITDIVPALIAHIGPDLRYRFANKSYEQWFNKPRDALIGASVREVLDETAFKNVEPYIERALRGEEVNFEGLMRCDHDARFIRAQYRPRFTDRGEPDGYVSLVQDIAEQKLNEQALQEAKENAERINAAKSRFLAAASHDLRQPLHALKFLLAALPNAPADKQADIVSRMSSCVESMGSMLDALLNVSELEAGAISPETTQFGISGLISLMADSIRPRAKAKGLDFRVVPSRAVLRSDPALLVRIVENLLTNAVRYTERGKVLFGCRRRGDKLRIEVWDTGIGIPEEELGPIFEEFHQIDNPERDRSLGLGLGLAIADRLAEILDHKIEVRSQVGRGSMFAVEVPLGRPGGERAARAEVRKSAEGGLDGKLVLVIENELDVLEVTRELLSGWGAQTLGATSCAEAVERAADGARPPDVIVADYRLPGRTSGLDAIQEIRSRLATPIPAVVVTGETAPEVLKQIESKGTPVLIKPVDSERLRCVIRRLLERQAALA